MSRKDNYAEEYENLQREIIRDRVKEVFKKNPADYIDGLEEIGFSWYDDNYPSEEDEEDAAVPENDNQQKLIDYFDGKTEFSQSLINLLHNERNSEKPNYPLIRKYFRAGNARLKALLLHGLEPNPTSLELLSDLAFFHDFNDILPELIEHFTRGCLLETDRQNFSELVEEFHYSTERDDYDALLTLRNMFDEDSDKRKIIDFLLNEFKAQENHEPIDF